MENDLLRQAEELLKGENTVHFFALHAFITEKYAVVIKPDPGKDGSLSLFYRSGGRALCAVHIKEGLATAQIVLGRAEQERFMQERGSFSPALCALFDGARPYHDGKWLFFPVDSAKAVQEAGELLLMKKRPNNKQAKI